MFQIAEGKNIILYKKGVYSQRKIFTYNGEYYAQVGSGFIGLRDNGRTTEINTSWKDVDFEYDTAKYGRMVPKKVDVRKRKRK